MKINGKQDRRSGILIVDPLMPGGNKKVTHT